MPRYKPVNFEQDKFIPINFSRQILPGTFEYTLSFIVDKVIDTTVFDIHYCNDETGAPAYGPAILLKVVLYAYARGILSSREIARACNENILFMALSADTRPHYTTIAHFISSMHDVIEPLFAEVLLYCDEMGLIGKEMFAIDGCKLPSNASKEWSGTKMELTRKKAKLEHAVKRMLKAHRERDEHETTPSLVEKEQHYLTTLRGRISKIQTWLSTHEDRLGKSGKPIKSNLTDNESAKMKTGHGVIQGYTGVAAVDDKHQVIVHARAYGKGQEHELLLPMLEGVEGRFGEAVWRKSKVTADAGFHTEANVAALQEKRIDGYIADNRMRKRDPRFESAEKHRARVKAEKQRPSGASKTFLPKDFTYDAGAQKCICPAGKSLYRDGSGVIRGYPAVKFRGARRDCLPCPLRTKCLLHPDRTATRQVAFFSGGTDGKKNTFTRKMKQKIDSALGRLVYDRRLGTVEPVFGNHRNHRRDRFTLRGELKVNTQWQLYSIVHNMGKIHTCGIGFT